MPKTKKNLIFAASLLILFIFSTIMAYFSSVDAVTNRLEAANLDILLTETKWNPAKGEDIVPNEELHKNPEIINKDKTSAYVFLRVTVPYILGVTVEYRADQTAEDEEGNSTIIAHHGENMPRITDPMPMFKFIVTDNKGIDNLSNTLTYEQLVHDDCWYQLSYEIDKSARNIVYLYAYAAKTNDEIQMISLSKGEKTAKPLFDKIRLINYDEGSFLNGSYSVDVEAFAIQTDCLIDGETTSSDPNKVWMILTRQVRGDADDSKK